MSQDMSGSDLSVIKEYNCIVSQVYNISKQRMAAITYRRMQSNRFQQQLEQEQLFKL